jgi:hypothetical protein
MTLKATNQRYTQLVGSLGKGALSALFPKDFESYIMGLELTDSQDRTIDYFAFPIMPESLTKTEPKRTNVKKTSSGITVLNSNSYVPEEISIKGNFGRTFKFYLSPKQPAVQGVAFSTASGKFDSTSIKSKSLSLGVKNFDIGVKTGFGAHSILRAIINKSSGVDSTGKPFKLYFYNMALGESYLVTVPPTGLVSSQNQEKNMIWDYTLTLTVLAPLSALSAVKQKNSLLKLLSVSLIQKGVNTVASSVLTAIE